MKAVITATVVAMALGAQTALASNFDHLTVDEIRAHPGFVKDDQSMSGTYNSGGPEGKHVYWWIGYIPDGDKRVYFTSFGEALTCVKWGRTGEWVPEWVAENLERLTADGYIVLDK
jgi:hypothetical protein